MTSQRIKQISLGIVGGLIFVVTIWVWAIVPPICFSFINLRSMYCKGIGGIGFIVVSFLSILALYLVAKILIEIFK